MACRKVVLVALAFCLLSTAALGQDAVPVEILTRTWFIRVGNEGGTAFVLDRQNKVYLVTARHVVTGLPPTDGTIQVWQSNEWRNYPIVRTLFPPSNDVDIAVLETKETIPQPYVIQPNEGNSGGPAMGQQVWFLGYPFGLGSQMAKGSKGPLDVFSGKIPFIKRGTMSAIDSSDPEAVLLYIDGFNNPGFSGGPIVYWSFSDHKYELLGVVKGYREETAKVQVNGTDVDTNILVNSGILIGYSIKHALEAIDGGKTAPAQ